MSTWRDLHEPTRPHVFTLDRVRLEFGANGLLRNATAEQVQTMTATPLRRARFVEVEEPKPSPEPKASPPRRRPVAEVAADAPAPGGIGGLPGELGLGSSEPEGGHDS